ncbi:hypothetical protein N665_0031s0002 [Sinapis alba]|nr:hypothetical protein N665_0031s0002 [Sinapis alba]
MTFLWLKLATFMYLHTCPYLTARSTRGKALEYWSIFVCWAYKPLCSFMFLLLGLFMYLDLCLIIKDDKQTKSSNTSDLHKDKRNKEIKINVVCVSGTIIIP